MCGLTGTDSEKCAVKQNVSYKVLIGITMVILSLDRMILGDCWPNKKVKALYDYNSTIQLFSSPPKFLLDK